MSKLTIQISTLNVYLGGEKAASTVGVDSLLGAFVAGSVFGADETSCDEVTCDQTEAPVATACATPAGEATASETGLVHSASEILRSAMVMTAQRVSNSSTGLELTETRKQGNAVAVSTVDDNDYVVVQAASAAGGVLQALGLIRAYRRWMSLFQVSALATLWWLPARPVAARPPWAWALPSVSPWSRTSRHWCSRWK